MSTLLRRPLTRFGRERELARFLRKHHSAIGTHELHHLGFSSSGISRLVDRELLLSAQRGSYRSGSAAPTPETHLRCVLLSAGYRSALTRQAAAHHLGLIQFAPKRPQVVIPRRTGRSKRKGFDAFFATDLPESDVVLVNGLRCTSLLRTILDLAVSVKRSADYRLLRRALRQATVQDHTLPAQLAAKIEDGRPFRGCRILEQLLGEHLETTLMLRSDLETAFLELCIENGIPLPETNVVIHGHEVDVLFRLQMAYVELDTFKHHGTVRSFEADRERDNDLVEAGLRGMRVTDKRMRNDRAKVVRQTKALLALPRR